MLFLNWSLAITSISQTMSQQTDIRPPGHALDTLRTYEPYPSLFAFYDGRTGSLYHSHKPNWLDDGAFKLGVCTYAVVSGNEALFYDAGITTEISAFMLEHVKKLGVTKTTTVYSHHHNDHIAGASALQKDGSTFIGHIITAETLKRTKEELENDDPKVEVVLPMQTYDKNLTLQIGEKTVEIYNFNIHTRDGTVIFLPKEGVLLAGDTLEDTCTYIGSPENLPTHLRELERMKSLAIGKILPAHGSPERIRDGGYETTFIDATVRYIRAVDERVEQPAAWDKKLKDVVSEDLERGDLVYLEEYERVHEENVKEIREWRIEEGKREG
ncbi:beta-lactamase-like protein [Clohesyomyces aquaticus]|uniref:Beta-lactamase-like protein n=1 Tax=Clohesyomyces aquaticus TaxID=1231657 RepID=A0A1Y1Z844_9PLEO|nr:beta-lactamase-like protein [Clohesyomyces aquaticus]